MEHSTDERHNTSRCARGCGGQAPIVLGVPVVSNTVETDLGAGSRHHAYKARPKQSTMAQELCSLLFESRRVDSLLFESRRVDVILVEG